MTDDPSDRELSKLLGDHATRYRASPALESAVRTEIALQTAGARRPEAGTVRWRWPAWGLAAVGFACGILVTASTLRLAGPVGDGLEQELVGSHVRALMVDHMTDIASTDQHTVKPWFQGKLNYSPPVQDLAAEGFPLAGGRLDYVSGRPVAALVYRRHSHLINVFVWPGDGAEAPGLDARQGYHLLHWRAGGMQYWAVSDASADELRGLSQLLP